MEYDVFSNIQPIHEPMYSVTVDIEEGTLSIQRDDVNGKCPESQLKKMIDVDKYRKPCEFCKEISTDVPDCDEDFSMKIYKKGDSFNLYAFAEDRYYDGIYLHNIHYCPVCGRHLV